MAEDRFAGCVVGDGCLLSESSSQEGRLTSDEIPTKDPVGVIALDVLIALLFVVTAIWIRRAYKKGRLHWTRADEEWYQDWRRQEQNAQRSREDHDRLWPNA